LAQHLPFDLLYKLNDITGKKKNSFFHEFIQWMGTKKYKEHAVKFPETGEEIQHVLRQYEKVAFPGCLGSIDCVHTAWDMLCPVGLRSDCTGKEGYPTLAFQLVLTHNRKILAATNEFYGTCNDKLISCYDETVKKLRNGKYSRIKWTYMGSDGEPHMETGLYFICGGGYQSWPIFICPFKDQHDGTLPFKWSKHA
jgi:hypothetical protein